MGFEFKTLIEQSIRLLTVVPRWIPEILQQPTIRHPIAVSLGAIAGALSRYYLSLWFAQRFGISFPYGTLFINITGCLAMGFFYALALERVSLISPEIRLLVAVGFLGAYTTFSTYALDTFTLLGTRNLAAAAFYWVGSAIFGVISIQIGIILGRLCQ
ncbi:fluoride efflux transporter CrcB [Nostoc parmelioides]|uniref:Fluoride-specific ion channel FluC n=1 Tax=Nostoc parmelioides FACHB-3921 TaxID=2692909 RepID=A0ABR8BFZ6_9NOSO|nr:fluoride efflux transporter CrcB [Nostoc parmelioides]MBD2251621.1 fluoride efflux transporter CrcB [Nostoc parmelioides FACHB-3921]